MDNCVGDLIDYIISKGEEHCPYCKYQDNCHGIACYGGEPIEPPCCYTTPDHYLDFDIIIEEMKEREEEDMNKLVDLYYERKHKEIIEKYDEKIDNDFNDIEVVKQYKTLIENFEKEQEMLYKTVENFDNDYLLATCDANCYKYTLHESCIKTELTNKYKDDYQKELNSLSELKDEVDAQLSLSDDLNYQLEVLTRYNIIDKKTKKLKA